MSNLWRCIVCQYIWTAKHLPAECPRCGSFGVTQHVIPVTLDNIAAASLDGRLRGVAQIEYQAPSRMELGYWRGKMQLEHFDYTGVPDTWPEELLSAIPTTIGSIFIQSIDRMARECEFAGTRDPQGELARRIAKAREVTSDEDS